jgi:uncharacterized protein (TIGR00730 family)
VDRICVFCGSSAGSRPAYARAARDLGIALACRGIALVTGGGRVGSMGAIADAALENGGEVIGVIPHALVARELAHQGLTELHVVDTMHERKARMNDLASGFVTMPGGFGTLDETCEILTWAQLGLHQKPIGLLNVEGYFDPLLAFLDHAVAEGFLRPEHRSILLAEREPQTLISRMLEYRPAATAKWIGRESV